MKAFGAVTYKNATERQWNDAAAAWHRGGPFLSTWLVPATEEMLDMPPTTTSGSDPPHLGGHRDHRWRQVRTHESHREDWRSLARFYQELFGCIPVPPERDFRGRDLHLQHPDGEARSSRQLVDDVPSAREAVLAAGGRPVGEVVTLTTASGSKVTWVYVTDPEGNVIELQSWSR